MVKLFVGNLADSVDSFRLRNLFLEYVDVVQECDVLKNFAFVHVVSERDAETVITKLDRYNLEGKEIHIERSTSRLRKEPGMGDKCFTCGKSDHKTPNCPQEMERRMRMGDVKTSVKRERVGSPDGPPSKITVNLCPPNNAYGYGSSANGSASAHSSSNPADHDPELPRPADPDLQQIYQQYIDARQRYFYYRDRLSKELSFRPSGGAPQHSTLPPAGAPVPVAAAAPPVNYGSSQQPYQPPAAAGYTPSAPSHPYGGGSSYYQQQAPVQQQPPPQQQPYTPQAAPSYGAPAPSHPYQQAQQPQPLASYGYQPSAAVPAGQQRAPYYSQSSSAPAMPGSNVYAAPSANLSASSRQTIGSFPPQPTRR